MIEGTYYLHWRTGMTFVYCVHMFDAPQSPSQYRKLMFSEYEVRDNYGST
jgi:hypothetical protein